MTDQPTNTHSRSGELQRLVQTCFQSVLSGQTDPGPLSSEVCEGLLAPEPASSLFLPPTTADGSDHFLLGYPHQPLYLRLSDTLSQWMVPGRCPLLDQPSVHLLQEDEVGVAERTTRLGAAEESVRELSNHWEVWSDDEKKSALLSLFKGLGFRGVLDLLGMRRTVGSCDCLPPSRYQLLTTFTSLHSLKSKLSVGARALSKHCHRDTSQQWWGNCTGSEEAKNEHALERVVTILREAVWINIHCLPHDVRVIEVRTEKGYGARWTHDGAEFRGFVEPQMADGHLLGWRH